MTPQSSSIQGLSKTFSKLRLRPVKDSTSSFICNSERLVLWSVPPKTAS